MIFGQLGSAASQIAALEAERKGLQCWRFSALVGVATSGVGFLQSGPKKRKCKFIKQQIKQIRSQLLTGGGGTSPPPPQLPPAPGIMDALTLPLLAVGGAGLLFLVLRKR